jgi:hypothetical protein
MDFLLNIGVFLFGTVVGALALYFVIHDGYKDLGGK